MACWFLRDRRICCTLVFLWTLVSSIIRIEGRIPPSSDQTLESGSRGLSNNDNEVAAAAAEGTSLNNKQLKTRRKYYNEHQKRTRRKFSGGGKTFVFEGTNISMNGVCDNAVTAQPGSMVIGNNDLGAIDRRDGIQDCTSADSPGLWYHVEGTGQVIRTSLVESNHTRMIVFKGSNCKKLTCDDSIVPTLTQMQTKEARGWSTFWGTEQYETYYLYLYGSGTFQMMLTEQRRPQNDHPDNPIPLQIGVPLEGSTAFASPETYKGYKRCDSSSSDAGGIWFSVNGTGSPLQVKLKTIAPASKSLISIYSNTYQKLECLDNIQHLEYFDADHPEWYPISTAVLWESQPDVMYNILIKGRPDEAPGAYERENFELIVFEHDRPKNDKCKSATQLEVGQRITGSTNFATLDHFVEVCSPVSLGEKPTAPGVWYVVTNQTGMLQVSIQSAYASQVTVLQGEKNCGLGLVCIEGTDNPSPDATDLVATLSSNVQWEATANETYYILVHGSDSTVGVFDLTLDVLPSSDTAIEESMPPDKTHSPVPEETTPATATETPTSTVWDVETYASLSFGFFPGTEMKYPSKEDVNALMEEVSSFFTKVFQESMDDAFIRFEATAFDTSLDEHNPLPVVISFTAHAYFASEEAAISPEDAFGLMAGADFQSFIRNYAWQTEPFGKTIFFQTLRVVFGEAAGHPPDAAAGEQEETVQRVSTNAKMLFRFFPDSVVREPSQDEINGLIRQTRAFFTKVFETQYYDFVRFGASVTNMNYTLQGELPVELSLNVSAFFSFKYHETHTAEEIFSVMKEAELTYFIQNYVWESEPVSENIFYETMHVELIADDGSETTESAAPMGYAADKAIVHMALSFNFHDTATVTPKAPSPEEIDGLMNKTIEYFSQLLFDELPDSSALDEVDLLATSVDYNKTSDLPVVVYTRMEVKYQPDSNPIHRASGEQVLALLETANMNDYVEYYVWFSKPFGSVFFAVNQAFLKPYDPVAVGLPDPSLDPSLEAPNNPQADLGAVAPGGVLSNPDATMEPASLLPVETDVVVKFQFFEHWGGSGRVPTEDELDALTSQTKTFFSKVVQEVYEDLIRLDLEIITAGFEVAQTANDAPTVVAWTVSALFYVLDGTQKTRTPEHLRNILTTSDEENYLHNYVWSADPLGSNYFFEAITAEFELFYSDSTAITDAGDTAVDGQTIHNIPTPSPTVTPNHDQVVVRATIQYGFLDDIVIDRKPTEEEQGGIRFQTSLFFNKLFRDHFSQMDDSSFKQIETSIKHVTLISGDHTSLPIMIYYEFIAHFRNAESVPTSEELYYIMDEANFEEYIEFYVWSAASADSMFFDTQQVVFQAVV